jgi:hypothetical protein
VAGKEATRESTRKASKMARLYQVRTTHLIPTIKYNLDEDRQEAAYQSVSATHFIKADSMASAMTSYRDVCVSLGIDYNPLSVVDVAEKYVAAWHSETGPEV